MAYRPSGLPPSGPWPKRLNFHPNRPSKDLGLHWRVGIRSGDTSVKERDKQKTKPPELLIITPESLHLLLAQKGYASFFKTLQVVVADEWHELMGSKRGVQVELALSRLKTVAPALKIWGISATIGNMNQAVEILSGTPQHVPPLGGRGGVFIRADIKKKIEVHSVLPDSVDTMPWAGHLGIHLLEKVVEHCKAQYKHRSSLPTRAPSRKSGIRKCWM